MTKNQYTHNGVTYIGLTSYDFGEMLYGFVVQDMCSAYLVKRTAFCYTEYKSKLFKSIHILAHSKKECINHLKDTINVHIDEGLKTYSLCETSIYYKNIPENTICVNLCKIKEKRRRKIIL